MRHADGHRNGEEQHGDAQGDLDSHGCEHEVESHAQRRTRNGARAEPDDDEYEEDEEEDAGVVIEEDSAGVAANSPRFR